MYREQKLGQIFIKVNSTERVIFSFSLGKFFLSLGCFKRMIWIEWIM